MLLLDLNEDVLVQIFYFLDYKDNINLALACRVLFDIAGRPQHFSILTPEDRIALINSCASNTSYGHRARSLNLQIKGRGAISRANVFDLLQRMPKIKRLEFDGSVKPNLGPVLLKEGLFLRGSLQELIYTASSLELDDMIGFLALPHLRILKIGNTGQMVWDQECYPLHRSPQASRLEHCNLPPNLFLRPPALECILSSCPVLETLICTIALFPSQDNITPNTQPRNHSISPCGISVAMSNVSQTLVNLYLFTNSRRNPRTHYSRLDLSGFKALKNITASADFWFTTSSDLRSRDGFYKLLPPKLEYISIHFGWNNGIFYEVDIRTGIRVGMSYRQNYCRIDEAGRRRFMAADLDETYYNFMIQVAENKKALYPMLRSLELKELTRGKGRAYEFEEWNPPSKVVEAFEIASVELKVGVRRDKFSDATPQARLSVNRTPKWRLGRFGSILGWCA